MHAYDINRDDDDLWLILANVSVDTTITLLKAWNVRGSGQRFLDAISQQYKHGNQPLASIKLNGVVTLDFTFAADLPIVTLNVPVASMYVHLPITLQLTNFIRDLAEIIDA